MGQRQKARELIDGEWHRLHPATPFLRGGFALIVIAGVLFNSLRDMIINVFVPDEFESEDQIGEWILDGTILWVLLGVLAVVALAIVGFWLSWRVHRFRITGDVVEVQQGILFRKHRRAPLARIQGINVVKPWFARLFGACKFEVVSAGADSNVDLNYLSSKVADSLRYEILGRASGRSEGEREHLARGRQQQTQQGRGAAIVDDFLHPDAEVSHLAPTSLVKLKTGTIIASSLLDASIFFFIIPIVAGVVVGALFQQWWVLFSIIPAGIGGIAYLLNALGRKLRFSIASTPDGIRLAYGLLSTTTEILPPGRIFSMTISQPLLWRPFGWWKVGFTRAGKQSADGQGGQQSGAANVLLPVGNERDIRTVMSLVLPEFAASNMLREGIVGTGSPGDGFVTSPPRARAFRWFSWRRNGVAITPDSFLMRKGQIWRSLQIVPQVRAQSFALQQGPIYGLAGLARIVVHVVGSPLSPSIGAIDAHDAERVFHDARVAVPRAIARESERWAEAAQPERLPVVPPDQTWSAVPGPSNLPEQRQ